MLVYVISLQFQVAAVIGARGRPGRPRKRPAKLDADRAYDYPACRRTLRRRGITPRIARRGVESTTRLGRQRWKVGRSPGLAGGQPAPDGPTL